MKRSWKVLRTNLPHPDSTRRWDRVYQLLLEWATVAYSPSPHQEDADADRDLRPGLDSTPGPDPDH
jgi:hypothetical protein